MSRSCKSSGKGSTLRETIYVHELPYAERRKLCNMLDLNEFWEDLGGIYLGFDVDTLNHFKRAYKRDSSPTDEMLRSWATQNHTVLELFIQLSYMHHYQAMTILKQFVPSKYHKLIDEGEQNPARLLGVSCRRPSDDDDSLYGLHNLDRGMETAEPGPSAKEKKPINVEAPDPLKNALEGHIPMISYAELEMVTGRWDAKNLLGKGGFGAVYKGMWMCMDVAVKRLESQECKEEDKARFRDQLLTELKALNTFRHDNILPLYGFSVGGAQDCLVYQYMPNGSLEDRILCKDKAWPLPWTLRHVLAVGIARGLQFLHTFGVKPLIHGDIKSANILLDPGLVPKIGDFGLAREGPVDSYTYIKVSRVHGTKPYLPNEFIRDRKFSTKVDIYSYGIVLFELASGLRAYDDKRKCKFLKDHVESVSDDNILELSDFRIPPDESLSFRSLIVFGKKCTAIKVKNRPEMVDILKDLEAMLSSATYSRRPSYNYSGVSDVPMTGDRQETELARQEAPSAPALEQLSLDTTSSQASLSKESNRQEPLVEAEHPSSSPLHLSSENSIIPAISILLPNRN